MLCNLLLCHTFQELAPKAGVPGVDPTTWIEKFTVNSMGGDCSPDLGVAEHCLLSLEELWGFIDYVRQLLYISASQKYPMKSCCENNGSQGSFISV